MQTVVTVVGKGGFKVEFHFDDVDEAIKCFRDNTRLGSKAFIENYVK